MPFSRLAASAGCHGQHGKLSLAWRGDGRPDLSRLFTSRAVSLHPPQRHHALRRARTEPRLDRCRGEQRWHISAYQDERVGLEFPRRNLPQTWTKTEHACLVLSPPSPFWWSSTQSRRPRSEGRSCREPQPVRVQQTAPAIRPLILILASPPLPSPPP